MILTGIFSLQAEVIDIRNNRGKNSEVRHIPCASPQTQNSPRHLKMCRLEREYCSRHSFLGWELRQLCDGRNCTQVTETRDGVSTTNCCLCQQTQGQCNRQEFLYGCGHTRIKIKDFCADGDCIFPPTAISTPKLFGPPGRGSAWFIKSSSPFLMNSPNSSQ